jgi:low affinity Fe/Cu permease
VGFCSPNRKTKLPLLSSPVGGQSPVLASKLSTVAGPVGGPMDKGTGIQETRGIHDHFGRFAAVAANWLGSTWAFVGAGLLVLVWLATGPILHFSQSWAQAISTGTGPATFLMVFLIQNMQNRDARAVNLKLNELILAMDSARNQLIDIERLTDMELDELQAHYEKIKTKWSERQARNQNGPQS